VDLDPNQLVEHQSADQRSRLLINVDSFPTHIHAGVEAICVTVVIKSIRGRFWQQTRWKILSLPLLEIHWISRNARRRWIYDGSLSLIRLKFRTKEIEVIISLPMLVKPRRKIMQLIQQRKLNLIQFEIKQEKFRTNCSGKSSVKVCFGKKSTRFFGSLYRLSSFGAVPGRSGIDRLGFFPESSVLFLWFCSLESPF